MGEVEYHLLKDDKSYEGLQSHREALVAVFDRMDSCAYDIDKAGVFDINDVIKGIIEKMIRRHPHVFGDLKVKDSDEVLINWDAIKAKEKEGKEDVSTYLPEAFEESKDLIDAAAKRKKEKMKK